MAKLAVTAKYRGQNGVVGYLTGETYHLELSRHFKTGALIVDREPGKNFHDVSSESNWMFENDEDFHKNFDCKVDLEKVKGKGDVLVPTSLSVMNDTLEKENAKLRAQIADQIAAAEKAADKKTPAKKAAAKKSPAKKSPAKKAAAKKSPEVRAGVDE